MGDFYCYFDNKNKSLNFGINSYNTKICLTFDDKKPVRIFKQDVDFSFFLGNNIDNFEEFSEEIYCKNSKKEERKNIDSDDSLRLYFLIKNILRDDSYLPSGKCQTLEYYYIERSNLSQDFFSIYVLDEYELLFLSKKDLKLLRDGLKRYLSNIINFRNDFIRKTLSLQEKNKIKIHHYNGTPNFLEITQIDNDLKPRTYYIGRTHKPLVSFSSKDVYGQILNYKMFLIDFDEDYLYFEDHSLFTDKDIYETNFNNVFLFNINIGDVYKRLFIEEDLKGDVIAKAFVGRFAKLSDEIKLDFKTKSNTYLVFKYQDIIANNCVETNLHSDKLLEIIRNEAIPLISETIKRDY